MTIDIRRIGGILPVLYSFFDADGSLRPGAFAAQTAHAMEAGAQGVILFGFVTQFYRLSAPEKRAALAETAAALDGRGLLGVTIMDANEAAQIALVREAEAAGADFLILQPPLAPPGCNPDWRFMIETVARATGLPVTIQNAAVAGTSLSSSDIVALGRALPNLVGVKAETSSTDIARFARDHGDRFRVLTGNWGVEYPFFARNGAHGLIPAPNFVPEQVAQHAALTRGDLEEAHRIHCRILPLMQFLRERPTVEEQLLLGKHALSRRIGLSPCAGRAPGPRGADAVLLDEVDRLLPLLGE
jgi:dihydrodipicolinate synthase/N-acetylneuraminate lyase